MNDHKIEVFSCGGPDSLEYQYGMQLCIEQQSEYIQDLIKEIYELKEENKRLWNRIDILEKDPND